METSWLGGRVPLPDLEEMIEGALQPVAEADGAERPLRLSAARRLPGADGRLPAAPAGRAAAEHARACGVRRRGAPSRSPTARSSPTTSSISTMPLPVLIRQMGDEAPDEVREAAAGLRHVSVRCVNIGVGRENLTEKHWIYYPEDTVFHRIFVQGNASPHCNPPGGFGLTCEITYSPAQAAAVRRRRADPALHRGLHQGRASFDADDPIWRRNQVDMPYAYVVYDHARPQERRGRSASGSRSTTSCSPAATASGNTTTPTTPSSRGRRRPRRPWRGRDAGCLTAWRASHLQNADER